MGNSTELIFAYQGDQDQELDVFYDYTPGGHDRALNRLLRERLEEIKMIEFLGLSLQKIYIHDGKVVLQDASGRITYDFSDLEIFLRVSIAIENDIMRLIEQQGGCIKTGSYTEHQSLLEWPDSVDHEFVRRHIEKAKFNDVFKVGNGRVLFKDLFQQKLKKGSLFIKSIEKGFSYLANDNTDPLNIFAKKIGSMLILSDAYDKALLFNNDNPSLYISEPLCNITLEFRAWICNGFLINISPYGAGALQSHSNLSFEPVLAEMPSKVIGIAKEFALRHKNILQFMYTADFAQLENGEIVLVECNGASSGRYDRNYFEDIIKALIPSIDSEEIINARREVNAVLSNMDRILDNGRFKYLLQSLNNL